MSRYLERSIDVASAESLMTLGHHPRAHSQLEGAVALHNILEREGVAYLADEVGLGKTYVALATMTLFRHFNPGLRVLVIAPKANMQRKWRNDWAAFVRQNWQVTDLSVRGAAGGPAREIILPERLSDLAYEAMIDDDRDFICRLTSFSFAVHGSWERVVAGVRRSLPWLEPGDFPPPDGTNGLRDFVAQAYNAALPRYDLVIIDEAHNLGGGIRVSKGEIAPTSIRNAVLAQVLGNTDVTSVHEPFRSSYGPIADRVLMISATPVETSFSTLWNQLHLVGKANPSIRPGFDDLKGADDDASVETAARILVRRVNALNVNGRQLTKNLYRRTWHQGGVSEFDKPLPEGTPRERLTVALVQKAVADEIGTKFGNRFQMGMLASFESFAETALQVREKADLVADDEETADGNFDDSGQADTSEERVGADTNVVNKLARSHVDTFDREMAHPKMDALVKDLSGSWERGDKALVFVRRIASVKELKRKLDERYDEWLFERLERDLPEGVWSQVQLLQTFYGKDRIDQGREGADGLQGTAEDPGGSDTFFSWFFRGNGPPVMKTDSRFTIDSGAAVAIALYQPTGGAATFFAQHHIAWVLDCTPAEAFERLGSAAGLNADELQASLSQGAARYLPPRAGRRHRFEAVQVAALEVLSRRGHEVAKRLLLALGTTPEASPARSAVDPRGELAVETFFTRLRGFAGLCNTLIPPEAATRAETARDQVFVNHLLATVARRGHSLVDLYVSVMWANGARRLPSTSTDVSDRAIQHFLEELERQRHSGDRSGAYWEMSQIVANLQLIRAKNLPETQTETFKLSEAPTLLGQRLGAQQPTAGMVRRVNFTAVQQFRMPGYPNVLICTDVLREGEDLHLFCDRVVHYGVAWTPSALEQRSGRVDRLYSLAERRFIEIDEQRRDPEGREKIQIQLPYVPDTVEVLQARRVIESMHRFTELMHHNVVRSERKLDVDAEMVRTDWAAPTVADALESAFDIRRNRDLTGSNRKPAVPSEGVEHWWRRLRALVPDPATASLFETIEEDEELRVVYTWRTLPSVDRTASARVQPYTLKLASRGPLPLVQAMTPVGRVGQDGLTALHAHTSGVLSRITTTFDSADREYDVAIEGDIILGDPAVDAARVAALIERVTRDADRLELAVTSSDLSLTDVERTLARDIRHDV